MASFSTLDRDINTSESNTYTAELELNQDRPLPVVSNKKTVIVGRSKEMGRAKHASEILIAYGMPNESNRLTRNMF